MKKFVKSSTLFGLLLLFCLPGIAYTAYEVWYTGDFNIQGYDDLNYRQFYPWGHKIGDLYTLDFDTFIITVNPDTSGNWWCYMLNREDGAPVYWLCFDSSWNLVNWDMLFTSCSYSNQGMVQRLLILGLIVTVVIGTIPLLVMYPRLSNTQKQSRGDSEPVTIVPGPEIGDYTLGMSKDEVLKRLGEPKVINYAGEHFRLNDLPTRYFMHFDDITFYIVDDSVNKIAVRSPLYKFADGLGVGDQEEKVKQAFGNDFHLRQFEKTEYDVLTYEDEGLTFEIRKKDRTVIKIAVTKKISRGDSEPVTIVPGPGIGDYTLGMSVIELPYRQLD